MPRGPAITGAAANAAEPSRARRRDTGKAGVRMVIGFLQKEVAFARSG
jgi:hypothetical protein